MPELPEAETIVSLLKTIITGKKIESIITYDTKFQDSICQQNIGVKSNNKFITEVKRSGKAVIFKLDGGYALLIQLGMTGNLFIRSRNSAPARHERFRIVLADGNCVAFNDVRKFGKITGFSLNEPDTFPPFLKNMGMEPLSGGFHLKYLQQKVKKSRATVKDIIMDQRIIAGVGNIYASEILFRAGILPRRIGSSLSKPECRRMVQATKHILRSAIGAGGTTISDYRDPEGRKGRFVFSLKVYGRAGEACNRCSAEILKIKQSGRSTFYCPSCQRH